MSAVPAAKGKEEYSSDEPCSPAMSVPPPLDMEKERARIIAPVSIRGVEVPAVVRCHVCFDKRTTKDLFDAENITIDLCEWGHRAHEACAASFFDRRGTPRSSCMFCCFHVNHFVESSKPESTLPPRLQLGIKYESEPPPTRSDATRASRCADVPSYVVAPAAYDRDTIRRRILAILATRNPLALSMLSEASGKTYVGVSPEQTPWDLEDWDLTLDDIIDHESFARFAKALRSTEPVESTAESTQVLDDVFMYLSTALERDVEGLLLFDRRGGGRDVWYGMNHAEIKAWAKTSERVVVKPNDPEPDPVDFVRTMLAHGITLPDFVQFSSSIENVIDQFSLAPLHLVAWGLTLDTFKTAVTNSSYSDSLLRPSALNAYYVERGHRAGFTAWDIPGWKARHFDESFITSLTDADWDALAVTIPVLVGMGMPTANIPASWFRDTANAPQSACMTTVFTSLFAPKKIRDESARATATRTRKKSSRARR